MVSALEKMGVDTKTKLVLRDAGSNFKSFLLKSQDIYKRKTFQLEVNDAKTAGEVLLALENLDIANVRISRTSYSKMDELKLALKSQAALDAKRTARALTEPLGQKVGAPLLITESYAGNFDSVQLMEVRSVGYASKRNQVYEPADVEFEKLTFNSSVNVIFKID